MNRGRLAKKNKGEAAIIFVFIVLLIILVSALTISSISVSTIRGAKMTEYAARAQFGADTGLEKAMFDYVWSADPAAPVCESANLVREDGTKVSFKVGDGTASNTCPSASDVNSGAKSLCFYVTAESNGIQKKFSNGPATCPVN